MEAEAEEEEMDASEKSMFDKSMQKIAMENDVEQQNTESVPPATPLRGGR